MRGTSDLIKYLLTILFYLFTLAQVDPGQAGQVAGQVVVATS